MAAGGPLYANPLNDWEYQLHLYASFAGTNFPVTMKEKSEDWDEYLDDEGERAANEGRLSRSTQGFPCALIRATPLGSRRYRYLQ
jgi:hypothetical protein